MCSETKMVHLFYIVLVGLMASLLFTTSILNYSKISNLEKSSVNNKCFDKIEDVKSNAEIFLKKLYENYELIIKNEFSKIVLRVINSEDKIINVIKNNQDKNCKRNNGEGEEIKNKLSNLEEINERIYDYVALNENSRINDNYNFYNLVKNQIIEYVNIKIDEIINAINANDSNKSEVKQIN